MRRDRIGIKGRFEDFWFDPQQSISTWELAQCIQFIIRAVAGCGAIACSKEWERLPDKVRRHFEIEKNDVF